MSDKATWNHGKATWNQLVERLTTVAHKECNNKGFAIISVDVMVDAEGQPCYWLEPRVTKIEPRNGAARFLEHVIGMTRPALSKE